MDVGSNINQGSRRAAAQRVTVIGFGRRLVAALIDALIVLFLTFGVVVALAFASIILESMRAHNNPSEPLPVNTWLLWLGLLLSLFYFVGMWTKSGQTIGKTVMNVRITNVDGSALSWRKALLRYIGYIISGVLLSLGFLWIVIDRKRQGWHDKIARTYVIDADDEFRDRDEINFVQSDVGPAWVWLGLWLIVALTIPAALFSSLLLLGPVTDQVVTDFIRGLF